MSKYIKLEGLKWHSPDESLVKPLTEFYVTESDIADLPTIEVSEKVEDESCKGCKHYKLACDLFSEICKYEPITQTETQNSNLTFEIADTPKAKVSGDCISRKGLIDSFLADNECKREEAKACMCNLDFMLELIENAPSVVPTTEQSSKVREWIPCSERLPDATGFYLCTVNRDAPNVRTMKFELFVGDEYRWLLMNGTKVFPRFVLAWMPLPNPWKGADDEM